jgi:hypothetical protein
LDHQASSRPDRGRARNLGFALRRIRDTGASAHAETERRVVGEAAYGYGVDGSVRRRAIGRARCRVGARGRRGASTSDGDHDERDGDSGRPEKKPGGAHRGRLPLLAPATSRRVLRRHRRRQQRRQGMCVRLPRRLENVSVPWKARVPDHARPPGDRAVPLPPVRERRRAPRARSADCLALSLRLAAILTMT